MTPKRLIQAAVALALTAIAHAVELAPSQAPATGIPEEFSANIPSGPINSGGLTFTPFVSGPKPVGQGVNAAVTIAEFPSGQRADELAFLQTCAAGQGIADWRAATGLAFRKLSQPPDFPEVFRYEIEYADGGKVHVPVRFGESIEDWRRVQTVGPMLWARDHWSREQRPGSGSRAVWYVMRFPNPRPGQLLRSVRALPPVNAHRSNGRGYVLALLPLEQASRGRILIVDRPPMGSDAQAGTWEAPFGSLAHAASVAEPGDTVLVRGGHYALQAPVIVNFQGKEGRWLTLSAFPGETPVLDGFGVHLDYRVPPYGKSSHSPLGRAQHDTGIIHAMGDPSYLRVQGLQIQHARRAGISVYGAAERTAGGKDGWASTREVEISFNRTWKTFTMGIIAHTVDDLRVIGNQVVRPHSVQMVTDPFTGDQAAHDHLMQEAIDLSRNRRFEVAFNTVVGGAKEAIDGISVEDGTIHHNYVESCLNGIYIDSWTVPIRRLSIHHNFISNAFSGVPLATEGGGDLQDIQIHHNIVLGSKSGGIAVTEATYKAKPAKVSGVRVFHNTIDGPGGHAAAIGWQGTGIEVAGFRDNPNFRDVTVADNIVTNVVGRPLRSAYARASEAHEIVFTHNLVFPAGDTTPDWIKQKNRGWDDAENLLGANAQTVAPRYTDPARGDFRLQPGSPAIGAARDGRDLGALPRDAAWVPGLEWSGRVTAYYHGDTFWKPVPVPREKFTLHRNHLQRPSWFQRNRYGIDFQAVPAGEQSFAGVTFHIPSEQEWTGPNVMVLRGHSAETDVTAITGIPVGRRAERLAFLHNYHVANRRAAPQGATLFHYRVNYRDGRSLDVPVRFGIEIEDWLGEAGELADLAGARLAWNLKVLRKRGLQELRLYALTWTNPHPDVEIASIDILNDQPYATGAPAVFAVSAGSSR